MSGQRKRDDLETGYLYRVVQREVKGQYLRGEWEHTSYGHYGRPRTYMTVSAARGMKARMERAYAEDVDWNRATGGSSVDLEFAVQRAPVTDWEVVPDA